MNIFFFWDDLNNLPNPYKNNFKVAEALHIGCNVELINQQIANTYVSDFYKETGIKITLDEVVIPAAKSDIIRLIALYLHGGWYLDIDLQLKRNLEYLSNNNEFVLFHRKDKFDGYWLTNMVMYFKNGHPLLLDIIKFIQHCLNNDTLMYDVWSCTGPGALTAFINKHGINENNTLPFDRFFTGTGRVFRSIDSNTGSSWKYQQAFGIKKGLEYNQYVMPREYENSDRLIGFLKKRNDSDLLKVLNSHGKLFLKNKQFHSYLLDKAKDTENKDLKDKIAYISKIQ